MEASISSFFFPSDLLTLTTLAFVVNLSSIFGLWVGEILPVSFGDLCPGDTVYPLGLTQLYTLWPWGAFQGPYACYGLPESDLGGTLIQDPFLPRGALMPFTKATVHSSGIHFGLCLYDCLLSIRQDYLGELCWPVAWMIFSSRGSFSTGAFIFHMDYLTVPGSGLVPVLE